MTNDEMEALVDELESRLLKKIYNMFYSWSIWIESEDGVIPKFEEAVHDPR